MHSGKDVQHRDPDVEKAAGVRRHELAASLLLRSLAAQRLVNAITKGLPFGCTCRAQLCKPTYIWARFKELQHHCYFSWQQGTQLSTASNSPAFHDICRVLLSKKAYATRHNDFFLQVNPFSSWVLNASRTCIQYPRVHIWRLVRAERAHQSMAASLNGVHRFQACMLSCQLADCAVAHCRMTFLTYVTYAVCGWIEGLCTRSLTRHAAIKVSKH
jgi:hypothetical protein